MFKISKIPSTSVLRFPLENELTWMLETATGVSNFTLSPEKDQIRPRLITLSKKILNISPDCRQNYQHVHQSRWISHKVTYHVSLNVTWSSLEMEAVYYLLLQRLLVTFSILSS